MRLPLTLRLIAAILRSTVLAFAITMAGWLIFVPATAAEIRALGGTVQPVALAQMRAARALLHFAPNRSAQFLSRASRGQMSPELIGMLLRQVAAEPGAQDGPPDANRVDGAKFVTITQP